MLIYYNKYKITDVYWHLVLFFSIRIKGKAFINVLLYIFLNDNITKIIKCYSKIKKFNLVKVNLILEIVKLENIYYF